MFSWSLGPHSAGYARTGNIEIYVSALDLKILVCSTPAQLASTGFIYVNCVIGFRQVALLFWGFRSQSVYYVCFGDMFGV
jgi:hypothetical protein